MSARVLELLLADARTPSGGYAHSGGLEAAVDAGLDVSEVPGFMLARLRTVGVLDAAFAACASGCLEVAQLLVLDAEWAARCPAPPLRRAARSLGRGLLRTAAEWFPQAGLLAGYVAASALTPRPVALGVVAAAGGLPGEAAARASLYDDAATVAAAAVKLLVLDAAVSSSWVLALGGEIESLAATACSFAEDAGVAEGAAVAEGAGVTGVTGVTGGALPSTSAPLLDCRALIHAESDRRLFVS